ncbi:hypothetical protein ACWCXX_33450, partial [Streptomyces sp. NPDC001732]
ARDLGFAALDTLYRTWLAGLDGQQDPYAAPGVGTAASSDFGYGCRGASGTSSVASFVTRAR